MSMIDELQRLLDDAGLEWRSCGDDGFVYRANEYVHFAWKNGERVYKVYRLNDDDGTLCIDGLTPEQAVSATLGTGQAADKWGDGFRAGCDAANKASEESVEHYKAENDKLRKMNEAMWLIIRCAIGEISAKDGLPVIHEDDLIMLRNMRRDLGIEVGE